MSRTLVVDYGMGNLRSVAKAIERVSPDTHRIVVSDAPCEIARADRVVFPGQGAARDCMVELERRDLVEPLVRSARSKPFLGICMGLQVLMDHSNENAGVDLLGVVPGQVPSFAEHLTGQEGAGSAPMARLKIPHMGWNLVEPTVAHPLWSAAGARATWFYFVHSYFVVPADSKWVSGITHYGIAFASAIARDNLFAVQFHPEKSGAAGLALLAAFTRWDGHASA